MGLDLLSLTFPSLSFFSLKRDGPHVITYLRQEFHRNTSSFQTNQFRKYLFDSSDFFTPQPRKLAYKYLHLLPCDCFFRNPISNHRIKLERISPEFRRCELEVEVAGPSRLSYSLKSAWLVYLLLLTFSCD
jgi:hypothetical protein